LILDKVIPDHDKNLLIFCFLVSLALLVLQFVISTMSDLTKIKFEAYFKSNWRSNVFSKLTRLPVDFFKSRGFGNIMYRFKSIDIIQNYLSDKLSTLILNATSSIIIAVILLSYNVELAAIVIMASVLYSVVRFAAYFYIKQNQLSTIALKSREQSVLINTLKFIQTHKLYGGLHRIHNQYHGIITDEASVSAKSQIITMIATNINQFISGFRNILVLFVAVLLALNNEMTIGMIFAFTAYSVEFSRRSTIVINLIYKIQLLKIQSSRLSEIVHATDESSLASYFELNENYSLSARGIYHQYDKLAPLVLVDINIDISENETVLLTGDSGSGKSTFIKILLGITEPVAGSLFIGGVNIKKTGKHAIRKITSSVLQGDSLFPGTIYENITFNDNLDNIEQVYEIADAIGIHDVITRLPLGYFTQVGDMSDFLSGGEKQK
ncbi:ATP-binding cassette domain-containing protein, partial [Salmonella enterica subsp. enterica serovar Infantis]|nr:ATP-binding cassette domain-containing protein [Salmonella enterica subsp. enterica serovar Infantis]